MYRRAPARAQTTCAAAPRRRRGRGLRTTMRGFAMPARAGASAGAPPVRSPGVRRAPARTGDRHRRLRDAAPSGCVADARSAGAALQALGFDVQSLFTRKHAAGDRDGDRRLLAGSEAGDTVVIHYAGTDAAPDLNQDESDGLDEAWSRTLHVGEFFIDDDQGRLFDVIAPPHRARAVHRLLPLRHELARGVHARCAAVARQQPLPQPPPSRAEVP